MWFYSNWNQGWWKKKTILRPDMLTKKGTKLQRIKKVHEKWWSKITLNININPVRLPKLWCFFIGNDQVRNPIIQGMLVCFLDLYCSNKRHCYCSILFGSFFFQNKLYSDISLAMGTKSSSLNIYCIHITIQGTPV